MLDAKAFTGSAIRAGIGGMPRFVGRLVVLVVLACSMADARPAEDQPDERETDPKVLAKLEEFQDLKFGLFIHWGPCSQWGARIAWPLSKPMTWARPDHLQAWIDRGRDFERFCQDFFDLNRTFNPKGFDPEKWAEAAEHGGMKYQVFVTKCHDGFCMFRTEQTDYCITDPTCPFHENPRADITRHILDAFRERGFRTGLYFSMPDWHHPDYEDPDLPPCGCSPRTMTCPSDPTSGGGTSGSSTPRSRS